ncbi:MAG: DUF3341 domain-containing protein [Chloroflexi bacterium]|nr:DUF3341 domain-containing protein [Chloroflexota bacterium]
MKVQMLGLFEDPESAAAALDSLKPIVPEDDIEVLSGTPYPEGTFGEKAVKHRLYVFPFAGAIVGLSLAILFTVGTQASNPLITGGKPVLAIPPMAIIAFEGTMLGAILFTVIGILFESRLRPMEPSLYDLRITENLIGVLIECDDTRIDEAEAALKKAGAVETKRGKTRTT